MPLGRGRQVHRNHNQAGEALVEAGRVRTRARLHPQEEKECVVLLQNVESAWMKYTVKKIYIHTYELTREETCFSATQLHSTHYTPVGEDTVSFLAQQQQQQRLDCVYGMDVSLALDWMSLINSPTYNNNSNRASGNSRNRSNPLELASG